MNYPDWLIDIIRCPETQQNLAYRGNSFIRSDHLNYPIIDEIARLVSPPNSFGEDVKWQKFYDMFAPFYDLSERIIASWLSGVNVTKEREKIISLLNLKKGISILEVSPGPGVYQKFIRKNIGEDGKIVALDLSIGMLKQCQKRSKDLGVSLIQGNASYLPFADESFDSLFHFGGVNLFSEPEKALKEFVRVVRKGGTVAWGDEGLSPNFPNNLKKKILLKSNPGFAKPPLPIPEGLINIKKHYVFNGICYLIVGTKS